MKRLIPGLFLLLFASFAIAQTQCTTTNPCAVLPIQNANTLPTPTAIWSCLGTSSSCTQSALTAEEAGQTSAAICPTTATGVWTCTEFSQTKFQQNYNFSVSWSSLVNFAIQGSDGTGGVSANTTIAAFQVPQAPAQVPSLGAITVITSGTVGPQ